MQIPVPAQRAVEAGMKFSTPLEFNAISGKRNLVQAWISRDLDNCYFCCLHAPG